MAAVAHSTTPAVTVKVYKNGNSNFRGKNLVINRRNIRTMEALYDEITAHIEPSNAVRNIYTPQGGRRVLSLENLINRNNYVAAGREGFKKLNYADLGVAKPRPPPHRANNFSKKGILPPEGRHMMDYEGEKRYLKIIHVFYNGDVFKPSVKIVLQKRMQLCMDQILNIIQEHVVLTAAIASLYTIDGKRILEPRQLITGENYVAVERGKSFKPNNYGSVGSSLTKSPRRPVLPPIGNGQMTNSKRRSPRKRIRKNKMRAVKPTNESKSGDRSRDQSRVATTSVTSPRDLHSNVSAEDERKAPLRVSQELDFTISATPPVHIDDDTPVPETDPETWHQDEDESLGTDLFKASGLQSVKGEEISDTGQTTVEKSIDSLPAEEVTEEVLEDVEEDRETIGDGRTENVQSNQFVSDRTDEIVADGVESMADNSPKEVESEDDEKEGHLQAWTPGHDDEEPQSGGKEQEAESGPEKEETSRSSPMGGNEELALTSQDQEDGPGNDTDATLRELTQADGEVQQRASAQEEPVRAAEEEKGTNESSEEQGSEEVSQSKNDSDEAKDNEEEKSSEPANSTSENKPGARNTPDDSKPSGNSGNDTNSYFS